LIIIIKKLFSGAKAYYAVAIVAALGANLDKFLIDSAIGIEEAGRYFVISSIAGIYSLLISFTIGMRQAPELLISFEKDSRKLFLDKYRNATRVLYGLSIPILSAVFFFYFGVAKFFQNDLQNYYVEFGILAIGFFISSFSTLNRSILLLMRAERLMFIANTIPIVFFLLGIYFIGGQVKLIGVCILFVTASILSSLLFWYFSSYSERIIRDSNVSEI
jgi:O-antigen/teichoic acid export membrane protein